MPVYPNRMVMEYKNKSYTEIEGSNARIEWNDYISKNFIIHPNGNYLYAIGNSGNLQIYDISDRSTPTYIKSYLSGLLNNKEIRTGMQFDPTNRYLYIPDGNTSLYTLDLLDPENPSTADTLVITSGGTYNIHVLNYLSNKLFLLGASEFQEIDISNPNSPSITETIPSNSYEGSLSGFITPDENYILYPGASNGVPSEKIEIINISVLGSPVLETAITIPKVGTEAVSIDSNIIFAPRISFNRMWMLGQYANNYFWLVYEKEDTWDNAKVISDRLLFSNVISITTNNVAFDSSQLFLIGLFRNYIIAIFNPSKTHGPRIETQFWKITNENFIPKLDYGASGFLGIDEVENVGIIYSAYNYNDEFLFLTGLPVQRSVFTAIGIVLVPHDIIIEDNGWIDISDDVRGEPIDISYGISGTNVGDRIAQQGDMSFQLNNHNPIGKFSFGHVNQSSGWRIGAIIRFRIIDNFDVSHTMFVGQIIDPQLSTGSNSDNRFVDVTCTDMMGILSRVLSRGLSVLTNVNGTAIVEAALNASAVDLFPEYEYGLDETEDVYSFAFDNVNDSSSSPIREIQHVVNSDRAYFYASYRHLSLKDDGGFRLESRLTRINSPIRNFNVNKYALGMKPIHSIDRVYNRIQTQYHVRITDDQPTSIVYTHSSKPIIEGLNFIEFEARFFDPDREARKFSAIDIQAFERGTDVILNTKEDGSGSDLSSTAPIYFSFSGNSLTVKIYNINSAPLYLILFQVKGRGVYQYETTTITKRDILSITQYGIKDARYNAPLIERPEKAEEISNRILKSYSQPKTYIESVVFPANYNQETLDAALTFDIGDKIVVEDENIRISKEANIPWVLGTSKLGTDNELIAHRSVYAIHGVKYFYKQRIFGVEWILQPIEVII